MSDTIPDEDRKKSSEAITWGDCPDCRHATKDGNAGLTPGCYAKLDIRWPECWEAKP